MYDIFPNKNKHAGSWRLTFFRFFGLLLKLVESHRQLLFLSLHLLSLYLYGFSSLLLTLQLSSADKTQPKRSTVTFAQDAALYPHTKLSSRTALPKVVIVPWPDAKTACSEIFMVSWSHNHEQIDIRPLMFTYQCLYIIQHLSPPWSAATWTLISQSQQRSFIYIKKKKIPAIWKVICSNKSN